MQFIRFKKIKTKVVRIASHKISYEREKSGNKGIMYVQIKNYTCMLNTRKMKEEVEVYKSSIIVRVSFKGCFI